MELEGDAEHLRKRAKQEGEIVAKYRQEIEQARARGNQRLAKEISSKVKQHKKRAKELNERASKLIFASAYTFYCPIGNSTPIDSHQGKIQSVHSRDIIYCDLKFIERWAGSN